MYKTMTGVDHKTVGRWRGELVASGEIPHAIAPVAIAKVEKIVQDSASHTFSSMISNDPDCEAARQFAIKALAQWPVNTLNARLENGEDGTIDGIPYRVGAGKLTDSSGGTHEVGAAHIAVALITNNGGLVYRFDARQLQAWLDERTLFVKEPQTIKALNHLVTGAVSIGYDMGKKAAQFGLTIDIAGKTKITPTGRAIIDEYLNQNPKFKLENEIRLQAQLRGDIGEGISVLEMIYKGQKKSGNWVLIVPSWGNEAQRNWAKALADRGLLIAAMRDYLNKYKTSKGQLYFYAISEAGADLIGVPMLQTPSPLPELTYDTDAETFIAPNAEFTLKVGDVVKFDKKIGRVTELCNWPSFKVAIANQSWPETWYENKVTFVEVDDQTPDPVMLAELDAQTRRVWDAAQALLICVQKWQSDEDDQPQGMNANLGALESLASLMHWVADTYSGQRLKLELPPVLEEVGA